MLKHIPTGQPLSAGSKNQHSHHHHNHLHNHNNNDNYNINQTMSSTLHHQHYGSGSTTTNSARMPKQCNDTSIYDSLVHPLSRANGHQQTPSSVHRHPLNHSQLSVNNLSSRFNHSHPLNLSTLSTSKHSIDSTSPVVSNGNANFHHQLFPQHHHHHHHNNQGMNPNTSQMINERTIHANGGLDISRLSRLPSCTTPSPPAPLTSGPGIKLAPVPFHAPVSQQTQVATITGTMTNNVAPVQDTSWSSFCLKGRINNHNGDKTQETGVKEMLTFLGLLCLVSLLLAMLSHIFLLKISPVSTVTTANSLISPEEYTIVYEVTLVLCALALSLNLCCLLVCAIQFMFAMKLVKSSYNQNRTNMYLQKSSASRMCAVGGFFVSIPVFLTGMILYTFIQFHSTPAIVMSVFIGLGIVFCGCAMVHNVFVWQREKTNAVKELARAQCEAAVQLQRQQQHQQPQQSSQRQQQQQQQLHPTTNRILSSTIPRDNNCAIKSKNSTLPLNLRGNQYHQSQYKNHLQDVNYQNNHADNQYRNEQMSPPLCLPILSGSPVVRNHSNIDVHRVQTSPPTTPAGDNSPSSPVNKSFSRSHHNLQREISGSVSPGLPPATLDLSSGATTDNSPHELSTLV